MNTNIPYLKNGSQVTVIKFAHHCWREHKDDFDAIGSEASASVATSAANQKELTMIKSKSTVLISEDKQRAMNKENVYNCVVHDRFLLFTWNLQNAEICLLIVKVT